MKTSPLVSVQMFAVNAKQFTRTIVTPLFARCTSSYKHSNSYYY